MSAKLFVVGHHASLLEKIVEKLNDSGYIATGNVDAEFSEQAFSTHQPQVVVIGGGVELNERIALKEKIRELKPEILFVEHFGSFSSLLDEVKWALD